MPLLLIAALPVVVIIGLAFLPRRWALLVQGVYWLLLGLMWLDRHVQPFAEDNDRLGLGAFLFGVWMVAGLVGLLLTIALQIKGAAGNPSAALWPLPAGMLLAVFFLHWLSNRLAGATPAWLVHLLVVSAAVVLAGLLWRIRDGEGLLRDLSHLAATAALTMAALVVWAAVDAIRWASKAHEIANGAPYCMLTSPAGNIRAPRRACWNYRPWSPEAAAVASSTTHIGSSWRNRRASQQSGGRPLSGARNTLKIDVDRWPADHNPIVA